MKKNFSKSDLQDGDKVTYRDGRIRTLFGDELKEESLNNEFMNGNTICNYNDELIDIDGNIKLDIIKVERTTTETIFERVEPIELVRGEIYYNKNRTIRLKLIRNNSKHINVFSQSCDDGDFFYKTDALYLEDELSTTSLSQKAKHIINEIENGWLWDDKTKELINID